MTNKRFLLGILVMVLVFGMTVVGCDNGSKNGSKRDEINETEQRTRIGTITVTGLSTYIGNYLQVYVFPSGGSAVGSSPWNNLTKINNPTVVIDFFDTEYGTFNPNGTYDVRLWIYTTNNISSDIASPIKSNIKFSNGFATIPF